MVDVEVGRLCEEPEEGLVEAVVAMAEGTVVGMVLQEVVGTEVASEAAEAEAMPRIRPATQ